MEPVKEEKIIIILPNSATDAEVFTMQQKLEVFLGMHKALVLKDIEQIVSFQLDKIEQNY